MSVWVTIAEITEASTTMPTSLPLSSPNPISMAKKTPAIGALKAAEMAAATPAATSVRTQSSEKRSLCPT